MRVLRTLAAFGLAVVGTNLVLMSVLGLNRPVPPPPPPKATKEVSFEIAAAKRPPPSQKPPPPRRAPPKAAPPPSALLGASLSGLSFGLSAFEDLDVGGGSALEGGAAGDVVMTENTVDVAPKPVERVAPEYPSRARSKSIEGSVTLSVLVDESGAVRDVQVLEADPPGVFDDAARTAVQGWRFEPGLYQGRAVPVRVQQVMRFALE